MNHLFTFQLTALALPKAVATLVALVTMMFVRRRLGGLLSARWLLVQLGGVTVWSGAGALELSATLLPAKIFWNTVCYFGVITGVFSLVNFIYVYIHGVNLPRRLNQGLAAAGVLILIGICTNAWHQWVWPDVQLIERDGVISARYERGPLFWLIVVYGYGLIFASVAMMAFHVFTQAAVLRRQSWLILAATLAPWAVNLSYILRIGPRSEIDQTPLGFTVTGVLLTWAMLRNRLFDVMPVAAHILLTRIPDPVLVVDPAGRLVSANPATRSRLGVADHHIAQPLSAALEARPVLAALLDELRFRQGSRTVQADDGVWWLAESTPLDTSGRRPSGHLLVLRDVTESEQAKKSLETALAAADAANAAKSTFLAQVSHDLRTPLHAILGLSETLLSTPPEAIRRADLDIVHRAGGILLSLINDLLDLSRIEARRVELANQPFVLDDVLDQLADLLGPVAQRKGLGFVHWIEPGLAGGLRGDADRLRQILFNLAGNAVKFTDRGSVILRAGLAAGSLRIEVEDTGPGIPDEYRETIFEPFNRGIPGTVRRNEGTGLGLAITRRLVEAMAGKLTVRSVVGQGTVFAVELPIVDAGATSPELLRLGEKLLGRRVVVAVGDALRRTAVANSLGSLGAAADTTGRDPAEKSDALVVDSAADPSGSLARRWREQGHTVVALAAPDANASFAEASKGKPGIPLRRRALAAALLGLSTEEAPAVAGEEPGEPRWRALLADDNELSRHVSAVQLARCGCRVDTVAGGQAALARLKSVPYDVVILDGQMTDLDGWEVVQQLRRLPPDATPNGRTPVVAFTADLTDEARQRWLAAGVTAILGKPASLSELRAALDRLG